MLFGSWSLLYTDPTINASVYTYYHRRHKLHCYTQLQPFIGDVLTCRKDKFRDGTGGSTGLQTGLVKVDSAL